MCWTEVVKISLKVAEGGFGETSQGKEKRKEQAKEKDVEGR